MSSLAVLRPCHLLGELASSDARCACRRLYREVRRAGLTQWDARTAVARAMDAANLEGDRAFTDGINAGLIAERLTKAGAL